VALFLYQATLFQVNKAFVFHDISFCLRGGYKYTDRGYKQTDITVFSRLNARLVYLKLGLGVYSNPAFNWSPEFIYEVHFSAIASYHQYWRFY